MERADIDFYFDPVCPFAWMTAKWVRMVAAQRRFTVDWRFISLRLVNAGVDYGRHFPPGYLDSHTAGLRLLRLAARVRAEHGRPEVGPLYAALGARIFETPRADLAPPAEWGTPQFVAPVLAEVGLPPALADAVGDDAADEEIARETHEARALTGQDVGTPIIHFRPPGGTAFFGPVISRLPDPEGAARLWDHVVGLASFPGFAELKRSLRERPQLPSFGVAPGGAGVEEDWQGGRRVDQVEGRPGER